MSFFAKNLRFLRKKENHNQQAISSLFHKKANTIGNWENQKSEPSLAELIKLGEFFKVSTQDLLHADLEKESFTENEMKTNRIPMETAIGSYPVQEPFQTVAQEGSPDTFWLILRELRAVNEKLDLISTGIQSSVHNLNSDKSSH